MLRVDQLTVRIQGRPVLEDVSLGVETGQVAGLLGPNGAGKTTCFRTILGQLRPRRGSIILDGDAIGDAPMHIRARMGIGYLPQEASVFRGLTVAGNIMSVLQLRKDLSRPERKTELSRLMDDLQIERIRGSRGAHLSGGERRRVEIARALAANPRYILLDEPFAGVDPVSIGEIQNLVSQLTERDIGVLVTDHNVRETLNLCDFAYILSNGRVLAEGTPNAIVSDPAVRDAYLGESFTI